MVGLYLKNYGFAHILIQTSFLVLVWGMPEICPSTVDAPYKFGYIRNITQHFI
jgi:hypothetical protein